MKFFEMNVRHVLVYGYIDVTGRYAISMWDFSADEYWCREGWFNEVKTAWRHIYHIARDMDRFNHIFDAREEQKINEAIDLFFSDIEIDYDDEIIFEE